MTSADNCHPNSQVRLDRQRNLRIAGKSAGQRCDRHSHSVDYPGLEIGIPGKLVCLAGMLAVPEIGKVVLAFNSPGIFLLQWRRTSGRGIDNIFEKCQAGRALADQLAPFGPPKLLLRIEVRFPRGRKTHRQ